MTRSLFALLFAACVFWPGTAPAQQILIDQGVRAGGMQCFRSAIADDDWYYVPQTARLLRHDDGRPGRSNGRCAGWCAYADPARGKSVHRRKRQRPPSLALLATSVVSLSGLTSGALPGCGQGLSTGFAPDL